MPKLSAVLNDAAYQAAEESLKSFYVQNTETKDWWLDVDEPGRLDLAGATSLENKKKELKRIHDEKKAVETELAAYKALGKGADEIKTALESNRPEEVTKLITDHQAQLESLKASYEEPIKKATDRASNLERQMVESLQKSEIQKLRNQFDLN